MNWIDEKTEEFVREFASNDFSKEARTLPLASGQKYFITAWLRTALQEARTQGAEEALAKVEEWARAEGFANPAEAGQFALHADGYNQALEDLLHHLQQLKDNKEV